MWRTIVCLGGIYLCTVVAVAAWAALAPAFIGPKAGPGSVVVVLGAGMSADGTLHASTRGRVERGIALYRASAGSRLHFTGGRAVPGGPAAGERMAAMALADSIDPSDISTENNSLSTLQNALFSQPALAGADHLVVVTEAWHLPRAWASFRLAGDQRLSLAASTRFRIDADGGGLQPVTILLREALAIWVNLARGLGWWLAGLAGIPAADRDPWLA